MNANTYYSDIRAQRAALDSQFPGGACLVTSLSLPGKGMLGNTCEVTTDNAARLIVEGSHRLASLEESHAFREQQEVKSAPQKDLLELTRIQFGLFVSPKGDS